MMRKLALLVVVVSLSACDSDESGDVSSALEFDEFAERVAGDWEVISYTDGGEDEKNSFRGIKFRFTESGEVDIYRNGEIILNGSWWLEDRNTELNISFADLANENESFGEDLYEIYDD